MKLNTNYSENNYLELVGKITSEKVFSHEIYGESFYIFNLEVPRLSGTADSIPITISERLISNFDLSIGKEVEIEGQFRSYNTYENQRSIEHFYTCEYISGSFGTGEGEEFQNNTNKGFYKPTLLEIKDIEHLPLMPQEVAQAFLKDYIENGNLLRNDVKIV